MDEEIKKVLDELKNEFTKDEEYKKLFEEGKDVILPCLEKWAKAKVMLVNGDDTQKEIAKEVIKSVENAISDIVDALKAKLVNYALEKLENVLRSIVTKYLIPALLAV